MLILSKHRDYYDSAVGMGIDKTIVYERHMNDIKTPDSFKKIIKDERFEFGSSWFSGYDEHYHYFIIGFCGKLYLGYKFEKQNKDTYNIITKIEYDIFNINKKLNFCNKRGYWQKNYGKKKQARFDNFVNKIKKYDAIEIFREYNTPVFVYDGSIIDKNRFIINPILKDYNFGKIMDSYTVFQEIQMFVSGVLSTNLDGINPVMNEKEKVQQHGMDKWSFRREPK